MATAVTLTASRAAKLPETVAAMLCFFLGLLWFLREIYLAAKSLHIGSR